MKSFTRKEYNLVHNALQRYELYMSDEEKRTSQIIQDKLYYFNADKIVDSNDDLVADAEEALRSEIKSLNFGGTD